MPMPTYLGFSYLFTRSGSIGSLAKSIEKQLREGSPLSSSVKITPRDVVRAMALAKSIEATALMLMEDRLSFTNNTQKV